ncbi:MAG: hypothetical protein AB1744_12280 [Candidatus Zixiibacteriota bacterium]
MTRTLLVVAVLVAGAAISIQADHSGRIYGRITTVDGDVFKGFIRWDKNEGNWVDVLDATKELPKRHYKKSHRKYRDKETTIKIFGLEIGKESSRGFWSSAQSGIRFGHIKSLEATGDDEAILTLKSGQEIEFTGGGTDIGTGIREIVIEDEHEGEIEFVWDDLEAVEFMQSPKNAESNFSDRLYGTLTTRRGDEFTGFICWDVDELFTSDILDGEEGSRKRKIKFGKIMSIERYSSSGATVTLPNGEEMLLRGTNDVNDNNSGIVVCDPNLGQVTVQWDDFDRLDFTAAPAQIRYDQFDGGRRLSGTVYTDDGESYSGTIRWDDDEEHTWEILDGEHRDIEFDIEFGLINSIEKRSYRSSVVTLWDGRTFRLGGSNDVDEDNKGVFVMLPDGEEVEIEWDDFDRVEFNK